MNKEEALKEKFKIALTSTIKVISEKDKVEVNFENNNLNEKNGKQKNIVLINNENSDKDETINNGKLKNEVSLEEKVEAQTTKKITDPDTKK